MRATEKSQIWIVNSRCFGHHLEEYMGLGQLEIDKFMLRSNLKQQRPHHETAADISKRQFHPNDILDSHQEEQTPYFRYADLGRHDRQLDVRGKSNASPSFSSSLEGAQNGPFGDGSQSYIAC